MKTVEAMVSGKVQGVGFRYFVKSHADRLGIKGHAMNLSDGRVEVVAQGEAEAVDKLLKQLEIGPRYSSVNSVDVVEVTDRSLHQGFVTSAG